MLTTVRFYQMDSYSHFSIIVKILYIYLIQLRNVQRFEYNSSGIKLCISSLSSSNGCMYIMSFLNFSSYFEEGNYSLFKHLDRRSTSGALLLGNNLCSRSGRYCDWHPSPEPHRGEVDDGVLLRRPPAASAAAAWSVSTSSKTHWYVHSAFFGSHLTHTCVEVVGRT